MNNHLDGHIYNEGYVHAPTKNNKCDNLLETIYLVSTSAKINVIFLHLQKTIKCDKLIEPMDHHKVLFFRFFYSTAETNVLSWLTCSNVKQISSRLMEHITKPETADSRINMCLLKLAVGFSLH